jgi:hypothetical protein
LYDNIDVVEDVERWGFLSETKLLSCLS